jgi:hypothetical protein
MKKLFALMCSIVIGAMAFGQAAPYTPPPGETEAPKEPAPNAQTKAPVRITLPATPGEKAAAKNAEATKKTEPAKKEEPKIKGIVVPRGERGFLGVEIVGGAFKITFYDPKKKPTTPDVARAFLRWDAKYKVGQERLILNPDADGKSLSNPRTIRPPHNFKLYITLIKQETEKEDPVGETHVIDFRA